MTKFKTYLPLILIVIIYSSCGVSRPPANLYGPAMYASDIAYQPKPLSTDSVHHATYVSASYWSANAPNDNNNSDEITGAQFNISQGYTFKSFNVSYNAFGGFGSYANQTNTNTAAPNYFRNKGFGNLGGRFSINTFITSGLVDIRVIGFEMAYSHEMGDFADYRRLLAGQSGYYIDPRTDLVTLGGTSEVVWHSKKNPLQFGLRVFIGETVGDNTYRNANNATQLYYPNTHPYSMAYFMQVKNAIFIFELNGNGAQIRAGLHF